MEALYNRFNQIDKNPMNDVATLAFILSTDANLPSEFWSGKQTYVRSRLFNISSKRNLS